MSEFKNLPSGWKVVRLGDVFEKITIKNRPDEPNFNYKTRHRNYLKRKFG